MKSPASGLFAFRARRQAGQGMTEYLIVVALIAVAAIGVYSLFGQTPVSYTHLTLPTILRV